MSGVSKLAAERHLRQLEELLSQPGNDTCADCKSKSPRWASHNLGIFICMRCAGLHRKLGTHISKVKSLTLDSWTKEQVESMRKMGNVKSNQIWNPDERKHPLPDNMEESERDSEMEKYIRSKYQFGRFKSKSSIVESYLGPSQSKSSIPPRSQTAPIRPGTSPRPRSSTSTPPLPPPTGQQSSIAPAAQSSTLSTAPQPRASSFSVSSTFTPSVSLSSPQRTSTLPFTPSLAPSQPPQPAAPTNQQASLSSSTFNDLISLQGPSAAPSLLLQYQNTSSPANPYASLSPGGLPSSIALDRSPAFRSASLPAPTSYGQQLTPMGGTPGTSSGFNPFFQQQQQQQQMQFQPQSQPFNSITPTISPISGPSPFNPFSQSFQQQVQIASPPPDFSQGAAGGMSPVAPQPQMFSMPVTNGFQPNQSTTPFGMINGVQPYQQTPSPSFTMMPQQQQVQPPPQMQMPWQQQPQGSSQLSQQAQQAQQLFKSMAGSNDGSGRNPFAFS